MSVNPSKIEAPIVETTCDSLIKHCSEVYGYASEIRAMTEQIVDKITGHLDTGKDAPMCAPTPGLYGSGHSFLDHIRMVVSILNKGLSGDIAQIMKTYMAKYTSIAAHLGLVRYEMTMDNDFVRSVKF